MSLFLGCDYLDQITKSSWKTSKCNFVENIGSRCWIVLELQIHVMIYPLSRQQWLDSIVVYLWNSHMNKLIQMILKWFCVLAIDTFDSKQMKVAIGQYNANDYIKGFTRGGNNDLEAYNEQNYLF